MRRVVFRVGLVPAPEKPVEAVGVLDAAADPHPAAKPQREHWLTLSSTLKTLLSVSGVTIALITMRVETSSRIARLEEAHTTAVHRADLQAEQINAMRSSLIPREQYYADKAQQSAVNLQLANNQQAILLLLARGAGAGK